MPPARTVSAVTRRTGLPAITARAASFAAETVLPAARRPRQQHRPARLGVERREGEEGAERARQRQQRILGLEGQSGAEDLLDQQRREAVGGERLVQHVDDVGLDPRRQALGPVDRGGDAGGAVVALLGRDDDGVGAEARAHQRHRLAHGGRGEGSEPHGLERPHRLESALGWISFCDMTTVSARMRSTIART